ncbi:helix-turn-helix transcriptional regulator [Halorussus caseinilyticus]|nr:hypothetical protein [Halorussus sp. DT72]
MVPDPTDLVSLVNRRYDYLQTLSDTPRSKRDLVDTLDTPRSTLDDIVRELDENGLVEYHNGTWQLTTFGRCALDLHTEYEDDLESLLSTPPVIEDLPNDTPVGNRLLVGAETNVSTAAIPDAVMEVFFESLKSATRIRCFTPTVMAGHYESVYQSATTGGESRLDLIFSANVFDHLQRFYPERIDEMLADENITCYVGDVPVTFSLWIADDDHVGIIVYTEQGIRGIVKNDTDDALAWGIEQYNRIQRDARRVSRAEVDSTPR